MIAEYLSIALGCGNPITKFYRCRLTRQRFILNEIVHFYKCRFTNIIILLYYIIESPDFSVKIKK